MPFPRQAIIWIALLFSGTAAQCSKLIPVPTSCVAGTGAAHDFTPSITTILYAGDRAEDDPSINQETPAELAAMLNEELTDDFGTSMPIAEAGSSVQQSLSLVLDPAKGDTLGPEGYSLLTSTKDVTVTAATVDGLFFGTRTLLQALRITEGALGPMEVEDVPKTGALRGYHLDAARKYYTVPGIKNIIRRMAWHKLNTLIWHAADAESFRFAILDDPDAYGPLYTESKSYSAAEIADLVEFGQKHSVQIIPGVEFPGHNSVYNKYYGTGLEGHCDQQYVYAWVTPDWVTDMTTPKALTNAIATLEKVISHFPAPYVHIGADELPVTVGDCPYVKQYLTEQGMTLGDLAITFVNHLADAMKVKGKETIIFNGLEIMAHSVPLNTDIIMHVWKGSESTANRLQDYRLFVSTTEGGTVWQRYLSLTPNQYHHLFPSSAFLAESWDIERVGNSQMTYKNIIGFALAQWGDYLYWGDDAYFDDLALQPRAIIGHRLWSSPEPPSTGVLPPLLQALGLVGEPPLYQPHMFPGSEWNRLHFYDMEEYEYPEGQFNPCPPPHRRFVKDVEGELHGSGYISDAAIQAVDCGEPGGLCLDFQNDRAGIGLAGKDLPTPWTVGMWLNITQTNANGAVLMNSPSYGIMLNTPDQGVTLAQWDREGIVDTYWSFESRDTSSKLNEWMHLALTANATHTDLYVDGEYVDSLPHTISLPMGSFGGWAPPTGSARGIRGLLDDLAVYSGFADSDRITEVMAGNRSTTTTTPTTPATTTTTTITTEGDVPTVVALGVLGCLLAMLVI